MSESLRAPSFPPDALEKARALVGMDVRIEQWNYEATRDTIRHYAWGIGDDNPLYSDPDYAARTRWGTIIAPPTFLYGVFDAVVAPGLPDIQWFYAGADWFFDQPVRRGDQITAKATYADAREVGGDRVSRMILQTGDVAYYNERGERVGRVLSHCFRVPRQSAEGGLRYEAREAHEYTREELGTIEKAVLNEFVRGRDTLYWDEVQEGDLLPGTVRGPLTQIDMTAYYAGAVGTSGYKSTKLRWKYGYWGRNDPDKLPNNYDPSYYGAATLPSIGHQNAKVAVSELGMPGPYDNGPQRIGFLTSCVTNWMGDDGFLREISVRLKLPVIFGDTTYTKGKVASKRRDGEAGLVEVEVWAENQLGQVTATGRAVVALPTRSG
jgi:acyl dehydratase